ncbi:IS256 family transposase [Candidatus Parcubacteria bacterium]|nr:MAG: IS256 family transposase [Candidatus Parcubacteria bacterium]
MTEHSINLLEYLRKLAMEPDADFLRESLKVITQLLMEAEVAQVVGAQKYERSEERENYRNGYRERRWETRVGDIRLRIPKLRRGSYFPEWLLEPRRLSEQALLNVIQEAYVQGISTRKVEALVQQLGLAHLDKSKVSRITKALEEEVEGFRTRPLEGAYPYVFLDALYPKIRVNHRVVSVALVIAIGIREDGRRVILGFSVGAAESEAFWSEFLRSLVARGLSGVQLVVSDAHEGLRRALGKVFPRATWQRCRVHFMRNLLAHVPQKDKKQVAAWVRTIFAQPDLQAAQAQLGRVRDELAERWPKAAALLEDAAEDILAFMHFPQEHWKRLASNNLLERLNREIRRRTDVVQVFPDEAALIRLVGALLIEVDTEWAVGHRYFSATSMQKVLKKPPEAG